MCPRTTAEDRGSRGASQFRSEDLAFGRCRISLMPLLPRPPSTLLLSLDHLFFGSCLSGTMGCLRLVMAMLAFSTACAYLLTQLLVLDWRDGVVPRIGTGLPRV